jgi:hypothetical protein
MGQHVPYNPEDEAFINNFFCRFPYGEGSAYPEGTTRFSYAKHWDDVIRQSIRNSLERISSKVDFIDYCATRSDLYLDQTPRQFFAELDRTVVELGLSVEAITAKIRTFHSASKSLFNSDDSRRVANNASREMNEYLKPVYIALRRKGYNKADLWA